MMANEVTPCSALFGAMKKLGGISYKELAGIILSGKPLSDGRSPVSRINDRTWVSRFVVHAPVGSLQDRYFCDFSVSALRIIARLKSRTGRALSSDQILDLVHANKVHEMEHALALCHQNVTLYRNTLERVTNGPGLTKDESAEAAMVLFVSVGCLADVRRAAEYTMRFAQTTHAGRLTTPTAVPATTQQSSANSALAGAPVLGLVRVIDGYVMGSPYWLSTDEEGTEIGALALADGAINDVGPHVSARHVRIWQGEEIQGEKTQGEKAQGEKSWYVQGLGSSNGTTLVDAVTHETVMVEPPEHERAKDEGFGPVEIHPGDELHLADDTVFVVIEGWTGLWQN